MNLFMHTHTDMYINYTCLLNMECLHNYNIANGQVTLQSSVALMKFEFKIYIKSLLLSKLAQRCVICQNDLSHRSYSAT